MDTTATTPLCSLSLRDSRTYLLSALFVTGNILLPQICHLIPQGGLIWLPIYFFTLVAAYRYGLAAGLLTAVMSPVINNLLFGMPPSPLLPAIMIKSVLLASAAAFISGKSRKVTLPCVIMAVAAYQTLGTMAEWALTGSLNAAMQDVRLGWPGMLLQIFGGYAVLRIMTGRHGTAA